MKTLSDTIKAQDDSEISLDDVQSGVCTLAKSDERFNKRADGTTDVNCYVYCAALLTDGDDSFKAVICAADGKYYEMPITIEDGVVTDLGEETVVNRKTMWVEASQKKGIYFNGRLILKAGGPGSGRRAEMSDERPSSEGDPKDLKVPSHVENPKTEDELNHNIHIHQANAFKAKAQLAQDAHSQKGYENNMKLAKESIASAQALRNKMKASSHSTLYASNTPEGGMKGHATRKTDAANRASIDAYAASQKAHETDTMEDHEAAQEAHDKASDAHQDAMMAQAKSGNKEQAGKHAMAMTAHNAVSNAHEKQDCDMVESTNKVVGDYIKAEDVVPPGDYYAASKAAREASKNARSATNIANESGAPDDHESAQDAHEDAAQAHDKAHKIARSLGNAAAAKFHGDKSAQHANDALENAKYCMASVKKNLIYCKDNGALLKADSKWEVGKPVQIPYMPGGISTITAGFRDGAITITVDVDEETATTLQASYDNLRSNLPKQEPFGCIEHREEEASVRSCDDTKFIYSEYAGEDCVVTTVTPTELGVTRVNGKTLRSWSPSFSTDANYAKAKEADGVFTFPEGVRGSTSNPARITGLDFCFGTLTNKPAFRNMPPVKARQGGAGKSKLDVICARINGENEKLNLILEKVTESNKPHIKANEKKSLDEIFARLGKTG